MTLDEAIKHAEKKAFELGKCDCASEHIQLAKWLKELKTTKIINIQEHIRFFNRLRAILEICACYEEADATYIELHDIDINEENKSLLNVGYSYTIAEYRDVVPAFEIIPLKYFEMSLDEIREDIKKSREEEI